MHQVIPGYRLIDRLPIPPDELSGLLLTWFALLPAALYVTWAADGRDGLRQLLRRVTRWRFGAGWWLFVLDRPAPADRRRRSGPGRYAAAD